jgi:hypothetical protein
MPQAYPAMEPADFLSALEEAGLTCQSFSEIADESVDDVRKMMMGAMPVAYRVSLLATLLTLTGAVELARLHADLPLGPLKFSEPDLTAAQTLVTPPACT